MALQSVEFNIDDIRDRINRIYNQSNDRIKEFMNIQNNQFAFSADIPWEVTNDGYPDSKGCIGKTILLLKSEQIIVNIYYQKLAQTVNSIFNNFYNRNIANRVCDLYIEFIIAHELAHVSQFTLNRSFYVSVREEESGIPEWNRSYEIEADNHSTDFMRHKYLENGNLIGVIGREIHVHSVNNIMMIHELISQIG